MPVGGAAKEGEAIISPRQTKALRPNTTASPVRSEGQHDVA